MKKEKDEFADFIKELAPELLNDPAEKFGMKRSFKGVWIPAEIWLDTNLKDKERLFLTEINSLDNKDGCWASNDYFAQFFHVTPQRASQVISSLAKKGYITVSIKYKPKSKVVEKRTLRLVKKINNEVVKL